MAQESRDRQLTPRISSPIYRTMMRPRRVIQLQRAWRKSKEERKYTSRSCSTIPRVAIDPPTLSISRTPCPRLPRLHPCSNLYRGIPCPNTQHRRIGYSCASLASPLLSSPGPLSSPRKVRAGAQVYARVCVWRKVKEKRDGKER